MEHSPQTARGVGTDSEVLIERQFGCIEFAGHRHLGEKEPVLDFAKTQHGVPAVRCLADVSGLQMEETEATCGGVGIGTGWNDRNDRREDVERPEDRLIQRRQRRISCERRAPNTFGTRSSRSGQRPFPRAPDNRADSSDCDGGTPTQNQFDQAPRRGDSSQATANPIETSRRSPTAREDDTFKSCRPIIHAHHATTDVAR